jgi:hypothetical protein
MLESEWLGGMNPSSEIEPDILAKGNLESDFRRHPSFLAQRKFSIT